jgi:hypothetical protein
MVWCITASNEGVDVDILFEENASIGKKIALTEKIVAALPRLKCPLQPVTKLVFVSSVHPKMVLSLRSSCLCCIELSPLLRDGHDLAPTLAVKKIAHEQRLTT